MKLEPSTPQKKPVFLLIAAGGFLILAILILTLRNKGGFSVDGKVTSAKRVNFLVHIISDSDKYLFSFYSELYPTEKKAALFFINPLTAFEDDDTTLEEKGKKAPDVLESALEDIFDHSIQYKITLSESNFKHIVDLLGGLELFFEPKSVRFTDKYNRKDRIYNLDGEDCFDVLSHLQDKKALSYIQRLETNESIILTLLEAIYVKKEIITKQKIALIHEKIETNLSLKEWESLVDYFKKEKVNYGVSELPAEPVLRVKKKDEMLKAKSDTVKVAFAKFSSDLKSMYFSDGERARIEVLNGTSKNGLARYGKSLLNDKGLKVLTVDNAWEEDFKNSVILNRSGNTNYTDSISETFQGRKVYYALRKDLGLDATVVLGEDFQGTKE
ncbi:LCP family protein [Leptospira ilyithenensis]|uniref:LytR family transcriptional regulator n=1 Tax=Leptospira ilyithenensis TaxID=2484901 RepID=A0A4R9LNW3_9LEPT|nr:LytR C-terminal domain-containing protein [Leptospira ilyithenensis]TGN08369.1 LytR family transcriptional regulator [Leptospira ilyithenensis]